MGIVPYRGAGSWPGGGGGPACSTRGVRALVDRLVALVIEDAADMRQLVADILRQAAFEVSEAATGAQGLDLAAKMPPDLVTLDLTLPDMDGIEVCRRIKAVSSAYVIMLTGRVE